MNEENHDNFTGEMDEVERQLDERLGAAMREVYLDEAGRGVGERVYAASVERLSAVGDEPNVLRFDDTVVESALPARSYPAWVVYGGLAASILIALTLVARFSVQSARNNYHEVAEELPETSTGEFLVDAAYDEEFSTQATALYTDIESESGDAEGAFGWDSYDGALNVEFELAAQRLWDDLESTEESDG